MEAPICRLCNTKHWSREPCSVKSDLKVLLVKQKEAPIVDKKFIKEVTEKKKFDRVAYQREYMRKYRAYMAERIKVKV